MRKVRRETHAAEHKRRVEIRLEEQEDATEGGGG
jgi:hypothetical protein